MEIPIFFGKRANEDKIETIMMDAEVYSCSSDHCNGWMRKDFASADLLCPICGHETIKEVRALPKI